MFFEQKKQTLIKTKQNWKWNISQTLLESQTLCFNSYKNCELK